MLKAVSLGSGFKAEPKNSVSSKKEDSSFKDLLKTATGETNKSLKTENSEIKQTPNKTEKTETKKEAENEGVKENLKDSAVKTEQTDYKAIFLLQGLFPNEIIINDVEMKNDKVGTLFDEKSNSLLQAKIPAVIKGNDLSVIAQQKNITLQKDDVLLKNEIFTKNLAFSQSHKVHNQEVLKEIPQLDVKTDDTKDVLSDYNLVDLNELKILFGEGKLNRNNNVDLIKIGDTVNLNAPKDEISNSLSEKIIYSMKNGIKEFVINVKPRELGSLKINLTIGKDVAKINIICESKNAFNALSENLKQIGNLVQNKALIQTDVVLETRQNNNESVQTGENVQDNFTSNEQNGQSRGNNGYSQNESKTNEKDDFLSKLQDGIYSDIEKLA